MPPVLGPVSPSPTRLKSWAGASGTARVPSHTREHRQLGPGQALLDHDPCGRRRRTRAGQLGPHVVVGLGQRLGDEHALARGQPVGLHHVEAGQRVEERRAPGPTSVKAPWRAVGTPAVGEHLLHPRLRALEPGAVGAGPEHQAARGPQPVGQAVDQRRLGPDHEQVGVDLLGRRRRPSRGCRGCRA